MKEMKKYTIVIPVFLSIYYFIIKGITKIEKLWCGVGVIYLDVVLSDGKQS